MAVGRMSYREHSLRKMGRILELVEEGKEERAVEHIISTELDTKYGSICGLLANDIDKSSHIIRMNNLIHPRIFQYVSHTFITDMQVLKRLSKIYKNYIRNIFIENLNHISNKLKRIKYSNYSQRNS
jgi:hypothetical protein